MSYHTIETLTHEDERTGAKYQVEYWYDQDQLAPEKDNPEAHGVLTTVYMDLSDPENLVDWANGDDELAMRASMYKEVYFHRGEYTYYDVLRSLDKAVKVWGCKPEDAFAAVTSDYEYVSGWYQDRWHWMGITVTRLDEDGNLTADFDSCGGYETTMLEPSHTATREYTIRDMIANIEFDRRKRLHEMQLELALA